MWDRIELQPGTNLIQYILRGYLARGLAIDNNSGSWLYVANTSQWIPPYTLGWSTSLPGISQLTINSTTGPNNQAASTIGKNSIIFVYDTPIPNSSGSPYIQISEPPSTGGTVTYVNDDPGGWITPIAGIPNSRIAVCGISIAFRPGGPGTTMDNHETQFQFAMTVNSVAAYFPVITCNEYKPSEKIIYNVPIIGDDGASLSCLVTSNGAIGSGNGWDIDVEYYIR